MGTKKQAEVVREHGPIPGAKSVAGVTYDGESVWVATGERLQALDPVSGTPRRAIDITADAGTAFDGLHLYQLAGGVIQKIDPRTGALVGALPSPAGEDSAGLTWAEGSLWVASHRDRAILQVEPSTGKVLRRLESTRFVTGVTFADGELWHATWENDESELRRIARDSGEVLETLALPEGVLVSGLEHDGGELFFCGGGPSGKVRAVRRPREGR